MPKSAQVIMVVFSALAGAALLMAIEYGVPAAVIGLVFGAVAGFIATRKVE